MSIQHEGLFLQIGDKEQDWIPIHAQIVHLPSKTVLNFMKKGEDTVIEDRNLDELTAEGPLCSQVDLFFRIFILLLNSPGKPVLKMGSLSEHDLEEWAGHIRSSTKPETTIDKKDKGKSGKKKFTGSVRKVWRKSGGEKKNFLTRGDSEKNMKVPTQHSRNRSVSSTTGNTSDPGSPSRDQSPSISLRRGTRRSESRESEISAAISQAQMLTRKIEPPQVPEFIFPDLNSVSDVESGSEGEEPGLLLPEMVVESSGLVEAVEEVVEEIKGPPSEPDKDEKRRKLIVAEILSTEESYVQSVGVAIKHYLSPLLENPESLGITTDHINKIFLNIKMLHTFNEKMLAEIKKIVSDWSPDSCMGPVFVRMGPFLKMYTAYSNKYLQANELLQGTKKNNGKFKAALFQYQQASGLNLGLEDFLIMPIQRIPRYSLLLKDLLGHTAADHEDYKPLATSLSQIAEVAKHINEEVRRTENQQKVEEMTEKGINLITLIKPHRYLLKEGTLNVKVENLSHWKNSTGKPNKEIQVFLLFNDIFVHIKKDLLKTESDLTQPQYLCPLCLLWLQPTKNSKMVLTTPIVSLKFLDRCGWGEAIDSALKNHVNHMNKSGKKKLKSSVESHRYAMYEYPDGFGKYSGQWLSGKRNGWGTWQVEGGEYVGHWKDDKSDGKGKFTFTSGEVYVGYWSEGLQHGKGDLRQTDNTHYIGGWSRGPRKGKGKIIYSNGDVFCGHWRGDKINGDGQLKCQNGITYTGQFLDGQFHGVGKLSFPNKLIYEGEFAHGFKHGTGLLRYPNGSSYSGEFKDDVRHGMGILKGGVKGTYDGYWAHDLPEGIGIKKCDYLGEVYEGEWMAGERHGIGKCTYADNSCYIGQWENDRRHGEGEYTNSHGLYKGTWVEDRKDGKGVITLTNGGVYTGCFVMDKISKTGTYVAGEGDPIASYEGEWLHGLMHGKGTIVFRNGDTCKGSFTHGVMDGQGTVTYANGTVCSGKWVMGLKDGKITIETTEKIQIQGTFLSNSIMPTFGPSVPMPASIPVLIIANLVQFMNL